MRNISRAAAFTMATLLFAIRVSAQVPPVASSAPQLPRWDVDASLGGFTMSTRAIEEEQHAVNADRKTGNSWTSATYGLDVGHYWTPHVKIGVGFIQRGQGKTDDWELVQLAPNLSPVFVFTDKTLNLTTLSVAATYQFRENVFLHPYVSAGARLEWLREHRFRERADYGSGHPYGSGYPYPFTVFALDEHNHQLLTRPFVAAGAKGYFNQRIFVRPEAILAFGPSGLSDSTFRIALGTDF